MFLFLIFLITSATGLTTLYFEAKFILSRRKLNCRSVGHHHKINSAFAEIIAVKVLHPVCEKFGKLSSGHWTGKGQFSF